MNSILSSNSNSSMISTLSQTEAVVNPSDYSLNKIYPFTSFQQVVIPPLNQASTYTTNSQLSFDLNKYGILTSIILKIQGTHTGNTDGTTSSHTTGGYSKLGWINAIKEVELLSSSRSVQKLSKTDILASFSDMPHEVRRSLIEGVKGGNYSGQTDDVMLKEHSMYLPLVFPILQNRMSASAGANLSFQEPMRLIVRLESDGWCFTGGSANFAKVATSVSSVEAVCNYINYDAQEEDKLLNSNYGDGQMSLLTYNFHDENPTSSGATGATAGKVLDCEIKDTSVVSDIYFYVCPPSSQAQSLTGTAITNTSVDLLEVPMELETIKLEASGQTIVNCDAKLLELWGRPTDKDFFGAGIFANTVGSTVPTFNDCGLNYIYKIQLGQSLEKSFCSGGNSLRELNNVKLTVKVKNKFEIKSTSTVVVGEVELRVVLRNHQILTIDSSNGRVQSSINN